VLGDIKSRDGTEIEAGCCRELNNERIYGKPREPGPFVADLQLLFHGHAPPPKK